MFLCHSQSAHVPSPCVWEWVTSPNFVSRQEGVKEDDLPWVLMAVTQGNDREVWIGLRYTFPQK